MVLTFYTNSNQLQQHIIITIYHINSWFPTFLSLNHDTLPPIIQWFIQFPPLKPFPKFKHKAFNTITHTGTIQASQSSQKPQETITWKSSSHLLVDKTQPPDGS